MPELSPLTQRVITLANEEAHHFNHEFLRPEHLLLGLVKDTDGLASTALRNQDVNVRHVRIEVERLVKRGALAVTVDVLPQSSAVKLVIDRAISEAGSREHKRVDPEHLLLALLSDDTNIAATILGNLGLIVAEVREEVLELMTSREQEAQPQQKSKTPAIDFFGRDLTELAKQGQLDPPIGRSKEIERVISILCRRQRNNPVLLGDLDAGTSAIVDGLAYVLVHDTVLPAMQNRRIIALDLTLMIAGTKYRGQFEERMKAVMNEVRRAGDVILYVGELHVLMGAGVSSGVSTEQMIDASNILKPALYRSEIQCIAVDTRDDYRRYVEQDTNFARQFLPVDINPPNTETAIAILKSLRDRYEAHHRVQILDEAIVTAVELTELFIPNRQLPAKAIELIDDAAAQLRFAAAVLPPTVAQLDEQIEQLSIQKDEAVKNAEYEDAARLRDQAESLHLKRRELMQQVQIEAQNAVHCVDGEVIHKVLAKAIGIDEVEIRRRDTSSVNLPTAGGIGRRSLPPYERLQSESVLHGHEIQIVPGTGFVLLPHTAEFQALFDEAIKPALAANAVSAVKANDLYVLGSILAQVWENIRTAQIIIADVSGKNANVIFELGLCFGLHRFPILLVRDPAELPFNLRSLRYIPYEDSVAGTRTLRQKLTQAVEEFLTATRPPTGPTHSPTEPSKEDIADR